MNARLSPEAMALLQNYRGQGANIPSIRMDCEFGLFTKKMESTKIAVW